MHGALKNLALIFVLASCAAHAERQPVLGQIDLPHPYYYREMYLPQLTSGPSSLAWSKDSKTLIYSMAGSLWRQALDSTRAEQLTAEPAYDYQPDVSPDGRWVIFSRYRAKSVELWALELASGRAQALTANGGVNLEARFAPDGRRVVFVSSVYKQRFHIFTADFDEGRLGNLKRLTGEHKSSLPRYYYSAFDHEISPLWSRDGREILFVSNRNHIYGTGGFWRVAAAAGVEPQAETGVAEPTEFHYEETNWKARPDFSPDGSRLVYASYLGRSWHNLWVMPGAGGDAFPIAYGDFDQINPRWSPDGTRVAFISNRSGNTEIGWLDVPGGWLRYLPVPQRQYVKPMTRLELKIRDGSGQAATARVSVTDDAGRFYAPDDVWVQADDGVDSKQAFEAHYFHAHGDQWLDVPVGTLHIDVLHGFERRFEQRRIVAEASHPAELAVNLNENRIEVPDAGRWLSADVHVHMNYGGAYRNTPANLVRQAEGEHLSFVNSLLVNKEQRFPDIAYNGVGHDPASQSDALIIHSQEYHTSYWGHLGLLNMAGGVILPGYVGYPNTASASLLPMNADIADLAHARGGLVGYVHPFDEYPEPVKKPQEALTSELPVDVALGKVDYLEILGFSDHRSTAAVWYQLLNLGFHLPAAAGTDAMANYASLRGPVGMNRVFARVSKAPLEADEWLAALKAGHSFATNGPLLGFSLGGVGIGDELQLDQAAAPIRYSIRLQSIVPVDHLELVCNGKVAKSLLKQPQSSGEYLGEIRPAASGWCVVRASSDGARYPVLDNYVYATTSPIYIKVAGKPPRSPEDARYFVAWIDRIIEATTNYRGWNSPQEQQTALQRLRGARSTFAAMQ